MPWTLPWTGFELTTLVVIDTDCIGSWKLIRYNKTFIPIKLLKICWKVLKKKKTKTKVPNKEHMIQYLTKYLWKTLIHWLKFCIWNNCTYQLNTHIYIYSILQFISGHTKFYLTANNSVLQVNRFCDSNNWARRGGKPDLWNVTTNRLWQGRVWCDRF